MATIASVQANELVNQNFFTRLKHNLIKVSSSTRNSELHSYEFAAPLTPLFKLVITIRHFVTSKHVELEIEVFNGSIKLLKKECDYEDIKDAEKLALKIANDYHRNFNEPM